MKDSCITALKGKLFNHSCHIVFVLRPHILETAKKPWELFHEVGVMFEDSLFIVVPHQCGTARYINASRHAKRLLKLCMLHGVLLQEELL